jgi:hypothetical protein
MHKSVIRLIVVSCAVAALVLILTSGATARWFRVSTLAISVEPTDVCTDGVVFALADNRTRSYDVHFFVKRQGPNGTPVGSKRGIAMQEGEMDASQPICRHALIDPSTGTKTCGVFHTQWNAPLAAGTALDMWVYDASTGQPVSPNTAPFPSPDTGEEIVVGSCKASQPFPAFTYQGRLTDGGNAADGDYDFRFSLYTARVGGSQIGTPFERNELGVSNGLFTALLNFDSALLTEPLWIEVAVRPSNSGDPYTVLAPRQPLTAAPLAINALNSGGPANVVKMTAAEGSYSAGDVLVIDAQGKVKRSDQANSKAVAGVYAPPPVAAGAAYTVDSAAVESQISVALWGVVPTKVTTTSGPIQPGDLLVTSTNGQAMKAGENPVPGTILGKALGSVSYGTGVIDVLVVLQ